MTQVARSILGSILALALWPAAAGAQATPPAAAASAAPAAPAAPAAAPAPTPTAIPDDPAVDKRAKAEFLGWQSGTLDKSRYTKALVAAATDDQIAQASPQLKALGDFKSIVFTAGWLRDGYKQYQYLITCTKSPILMLYALDADGKVAGVRFRPVPPPQ
jgi:hypothetical protein